MQLCIVNLSLYFIEYADFSIQRFSFCLAGFSITKVYLFIAILTLISLPIPSILFFLLPRHLKYWISLFLFSLIRLLVLHQCSLFKGWILDGDREDWLWGFCFVSLCFFGFCFFFLVQHTWCKASLLVLVVALYIFKYYLFPNLSYNHVNFFLKFPNSPGISLNLFHKFYESLSESLWSLYRNMSFILFYCDNEVGIWSLYFLSESCLSL